jgi:hypothetical protein
VSSERFTTRCVDHFRHYSTLYTTHYTLHATHFLHDWKRHREGCQRGIIHYRAQVQRTKTTPCASQSGISVISLCSRSALPFQIISFDNYLPVNARLFLTPQGRPPRRSRKAFGNRDSQHSLHVYGLDLPLPLLYWILLSIRHCTIITRSTCFSSANSASTVVRYAKDLAWVAPVVRFYTTEYAARRLRAFRSIEPSRIWPTSNQGLFGTYSTTHFHTHSEHNQTPAQHSI